MGLFINFKRKIGTLMCGELLLYLSRIHMFLQASLPGGGEESPSFAMLGPC